MAVPSASTMKQKVLASYGQKLGPDAQEYLEKLLSAVESGWSSWQNGISFGGLTVSGAGVGAWSGSGADGTMSGGAYTMPDFSFKSNSPQQVKFTKGLAQVLASKFTAFPASYKVLTLSYTGTSGATPSSPGPISAVNVAVPMSTGGSGQNPSGIADMWKNVLTPPDFDLRNPNCKSGALVDAIGSTIEKEFATWLLTTMLVGNSLSATGAPGGAASGIKTVTDGKLA